jgi:hypothetical protein
MCMLALANPGQRLDLESFKPCILKFYIQNKLIGLEFRDLYFCYQSTTTINPCLRKK